MKILMLAENDPAGTGILFKKAFDRHSNHEVRLITWETRYVCNFDKDLHIPDHKDTIWDEVEVLLKEADIFHFHMVIDENTQPGPFKIGDYSREKPIVRHHHGHPKFRGNPAYFDEKYARTKDFVIVSTPDLVDMFTKTQVTWVPNFVLLDSDYYKVKDLLDWEQRSGLPIRICQSPTRKDLKSTDKLISIINQLREEGFPLELKIADMLPHSEVMKEKRKSDLVFDQLDLTYGVASLESLAIGVPVICKLPFKQIRRIQDFSTCLNLPWINLHCAEEFKFYLRDLLKTGNPQDAREKLIKQGTISRKFMEKYWHESKVVALLEEIYEKSKFS